MYMTWPITNVFYRLIYISIQDPSWDGYLYHWHVITSHPFIGKKLPSTSYCQLSLYLNAQTNNYFHVMESSTVDFKINCFRYALKPGYESVVKGFSVYNVWRMMTEWTQMFIRLWLHYCPHKWPAINMQNDLSHFNILLRSPIKPYDNNMWCEDTGAEDIANFVFWEESLFSSVWGCVWSYQQNQKNEILIKHKVFKTSPKDFCFWLEYERLRFTLKE